MSTFEHASRGHDARVTISSPQPLLTRVAIRRQSHFVHLESPAIALAPGNIDALTRLGHLLQIEGRTWEAAPLFFARILRGRRRGDELLGASGTERFFRSDELLEVAAIAANPADPLIKIGQARREFYANNTALAESILRETLSQQPQLGEAQARYGRIVVNRGDLAEFLAWRGSLPDDARDHPEVWYVQGLKARQLNQIEGAARCYLEAIALDPNHLRGIAFDANGSAQASMGVAAGDVTGDGRIDRC